MAHVSNGPIGFNNPVEKVSPLPRSSSEPELGIVVKSCANMSQQGKGSKRVDSKSSLSSLSSGEFRQRSATHGGSTASMKKIAMLRKQRKAAQRKQNENHHDINGLSRRHSQDLIKAQAFEKVQEQLDRAKEELKLKDEEVEKLSNLRNELESELEDLTASLFQEAHAMVLEANIKQSNAEKKFNETNCKVEMLEAEVEALKTLVITSTPSKPGFRRRSTEQLNSCDSCGSVHCTTLDHINQENSTGDGRNLNQDREVDVVVFKEFLAWMEERLVDRSQPFLSRMYTEDVMPCLDFTNEQLSKTFQQAIENNSLVMELMSTKGIRRKCALTEAMRLCQYRIAVSDTGEWHYICQSARHRIAAVCDFFTYIRYIQHGLVKKEVTDIYWEIMELRNQMACAKCGLTLNH